MSSAPRRRRRMFSGGQSRWEDDPNGANVVEQSLSERDHSDAVEEADAIAQEHGRDMDHELV